MKLTSLVWSILLISKSIFAQDCTFDSYQKKGGLYYFSTFYQNYDPKQVREGVCQRIFNEKPYEYREFKNGQLQVERLYSLENGKVYSEFKRFKKDSIIAQLIYKPNGEYLEHIQTFYLNKEKKRCWKDEIYRGGKIYSVQHYRNFTLQELLDAGYPTRPEHVVDADGYSDVSVLFGPELTYHSNGKIQSIKHHELIITDYPYLTNTQTGTYFLYAENGQELQRGTYKEGQPNGEFIYHHMNGKLSAKRYFENGISIGNWVEYYDDGSLWSTVDYGEEYYWPTGHEKRYFQNGKLQYERIIDKNGKGFQIAYYDNGIMQEQTVYEHGPQERTAFFQWFPSGQLQQKIYWRAQNDTLVAEFYADGFLKHLNLQFKDTRNQEIRTYFTNHALASFNKIENSDGNVKQTYITYSENGMPIKAIDYNGPKRQTKDYWTNGVLKVELSFDQHLLNGWWIEQDSLGNTTKKCHYTLGYRDSNCIVRPTIRLEKLSKEQEQAVLPLTYKGIVESNYLKPTILDEKGVDEKVELVRKSFQYLYANYPSFGLEKLTDSITHFEYQFNMSIELYQKFGEQLDSIFKVLKFKTIHPIKSIGYYTGTFSSKAFYNNRALDSLMNPILSNGSTYFQLKPMKRFITDMEYHPRHQQDNTLQFEYKDAIKVWVVTINNTPVVHYPDGQIEIYNGNGITDRYQNLNLNHLMYED
jgi:antitoxin component YwqK of YwqJK toxin-antitoxin module